MKKKPNSIISVILALSMVFTFSSCDKEPKEDRPDLPPQESLFMDFSDFNQQPGGKKSAPASIENALHAYLSILVWNTVSTVTLIVPVTAYGIALQQTPEYLGDYTWEWSFSVPVGILQYKATLTGTRLNNEEFSMEMVIAPALNPEEGVKWFDGVVRYDHTHASWNLYDGDGIKLIEVEWNKDFETGEADLTYTYVEPGQNLSDSYIELAYMPEEFYDASYTIFLTSNSNETDIEWNKETKEGRVMDMARFQDDAWHCWDTNANGLVDKVCE